MFENIAKIVFITSESCNLNCKYCEISKNSNKNHLKEQEKIKQALADGSYVTRYMQVFNKYNIDVKKITSLDLWGQEPTLTLNEFSSQFDRIMDWLVNCKLFFFSTNAIAYPERIINFIKVVNNYFIDQDSRPFIAQIQFSFDGKEPTLEKRGIDPEIIINNIKYIISETNKINIDKKVLFRFSFHGVLTMDIIKKGLDTNVDDHWLEEDSLLKEFTNLNTNKRIEIGPTIFTHFQQPQYATGEDGKLVAEYTKRCLNSTASFKQSYLGILSPFAHAARSILLTQYKDPILMPYKVDGELNTYSSSDIFKYKIDDIYDSFNYEYDKMIPENDYLISDLYGCGAGAWQLKMRYNGDILYCQNTFYGTNKENFEGKVGADFDIQRFECDHPGFQPNLLTSSEEDIKNFINIFDVKRHYGHMCLLSNTINLMHILLKNKQIDLSYENNNEKILRHSIYLSQFVQCFYNNIIDTGTLYSLSVGSIRFFCNGMLDIVEDYAKKWGYFGPWN